MAWGRVALSEEVARALNERRPVVALESTIVAHGMPFPQNLETARSLEAIIRGKGAVPATIAIMDGVPKAGLTESELAEIAQNGQLFEKVSRRDLGYQVAKKGNGATTVATTMLIAHWAGIRVFATGGIGGVHRGAETTFDISADLHELAKTPVAVVSAGAKSILDLPKTLEYLETLGVPVVGYGTDEFPAFYVRKSGLKLPLVLHNAQAIADAFYAQLQMGLDMGMLVANPIPAADEPEALPIAHAIDQAIAEAETKQVQGKALTPFLLAKIKDLTGGKSLKANVALAQNNARLAAEIAGALCHLEKH